MKYDFTAIEQRWQAHWAESGTFATPNPGDEGFDPERPKYYVLDMFPYPSGVGLHVGHPLGYIATDIVARYKRMTGFNVLHPMGYDAFGLPAEQFAVEHGVHPRITTQKNIDNMTRQLKQLGLSYDWDRCISTTDTDYYKWTQWIFLQLYNSWFDRAQDKARPISELEQLLGSERMYVGPTGELVASSAEGLDAIEGAPIGALKWFELDEQQRREVLDSQRMAYLAEVPVNWCPALGTVLANEEVTNDGRSERGNHPVSKRPLRQWMLRITSYCERLINDLDLIDWPEPIKIMQRNWVGRSEGAMVDFAVNDSDDLISVYTTRPDTLFGATYMVLAPEHPLVETLTTDDCRAAVNQYRAEAASRSDVDRMAETKEKTGVFTGAYAINPVNGEGIPIWIADYVLTGYGTGAIMAVPAHDSRDFEFAKTFDLPIVQVVAGETDGEASGGAMTDDGVAMNSSNDEVSINDLPTAEAKSKITDWLESKGLGRFQVQYKLRDWLFSRQRYWGEPFPILHGPDGEIIGVDESELPVELPEMEDFKPHASDDPNAPVQTPLSRAPDSWKFIERDGKTYTRELNTMPQWAGSCWYYLRFIDSKNGDRFVGEDAENYWMISSKKDGTPHSGGIDLYVGGAEHAVLHLLYSRFWHKVLFDLGHVKTPEPFGRLFNQGYIQAYSYQDPRGIYVPALEVTAKDGTSAADVEDQAKVDLVHNDESVTRNMGKMGKSLKNAVAPDDICEQYGCDTMRLYEMYLGPLEQSKMWRTRDIVGVHRFLQRLWRNFVDEDSDELLITDDAAPDDLRKKLHKTIKRVTDGMNSLSFNTAIAALIELNNDLVAIDRVPREVADPMVLCLAPMAPHIAEELWNRMGHDQSLAHHKWPSYDESLLVEDEILYPVQVNGKLRSKITIAASADDAAIEAVVMDDEKVKATIDGKTVRKVIIIKGRLVNIVAN